MRAVVVALALFVALASCAATAQVRVAHASPNAPGVDVYVNGKRVVSDLLFTNVTSYLSLAPAYTNIQVKVAGTQTVVINATVPFSASNFYTVAATGYVTNLAPVVFVDDNRAPASGYAAVRFIHLSPNAPAVNVAVAGGPTLFSDVSFRSATTYLQVASGTYNLVVDVAQSGATALKLPGITFAAGKAYTAFAEGLVGGSGAESLQAVLAVDL